MKLFCDLHMHSCLSPCGDDLMTPNNIVNMSALKELDIISVTDHNTARNLPAVMEVAKEVGMLVIPGMEVSVREEAHVLTYFRTLDAALEYGEYVYNHLPDIDNNEEYFGKQQIMNSNDEEIGRLSKLLISATDISLDKVVEDVLALEGVAVPAHVDKKANSVVQSLGFIPPGLDIKTLELSKHTKIGEYDMAAILGDYKYTTSSDAHQLEDILERVFTISAEARTVDSVIDYLREHK